MPAAGTTVNELKETVNEKVDQLKTRVIDVKDQAIDRGPAARAHGRAHGIQFFMGGTGHLLAAGAHDHGHGGFLGPNTELIFAVGSGVALTIGWLIEWRLIFPSLPAFVVALALSEGGWRRRAAMIGLLLASIVATARMACGLSA